MILICSGVQKSVWKLVSVAGKFLTFYFTILTIDIDINSIKQFELWENSDFSSCNSEFKSHSSVLLFVFVSAMK